MKENRQVYRSLCQSHYIPWYAQAWWLDASCGSDQWQVVLAKDKHGAAVGALPFYLARRYGLSAIRMPALTAQSHIWIQPSSSERRVYQYGHQQGILKQLIEQFPSVRIFDQNFDTSLENTLPFHWAGYETHVRYTYQLRNLGVLERIWPEMDTSIRNHIRKARDQVRLIEPSDEILFQLIQTSLQRKGIRLPVSEEQLSHLLHAIRTHARLRVYGATVNGKTEAAIAVIEDQQKAYYWLSGATQIGRQTGCIPFLLWEAIKKASREVSTFDFEGSMAPGVESLFRSFGGERRPYYRIRQIKPRLLNTFYR